MNSYQDPTVLFFYLYGAYTAKSPYDIRKFVLISFISEKVKGHRKHLLYKAGCAHLSHGSKSVNRHT